MAEAPRSSFIPKQTNASLGKKKKRRWHFSIFRIVSYVLFFSVLLLAAGMFFYKDYTLKELAEERATLNEERLRFNTEDITRVRSFDLKLKAVEYLLDNHRSPSRVFDELEFNTVEPVMYTEFTYTRTADGANVTISGATPELRTLAAQALTFSGSEVFTDRTLSGIGDRLEGVPGSEDEEGAASPEGVDLPDVTFSVTAAIPGSALAYSSSQSTTNAQSSDANTAGQDADTSGATSAEGDAAEGADGAVEGDDSGTAGATTTEGTAPVQ